MRILTAYCPHCDANVLVTCMPDGETSANAAPDVWLPCVVVKCAAKGHVIVRLGAVYGADPAVDAVLAGVTRQRMGVPA